MQEHSDSTLAGIVASYAVSAPEREAIIFEGGDTRPDDVLTYGDLWRNAQRLAVGLKRLGTRPGDYIGVLMANHAEFVELMVAAGIVGAVFVPIDPRTKGSRLAYVLQSAGCAGVLAADYTLPALMTIRSQLPRLQWIVGLETDEATDSIDAHAEVISYRSICTEHSDLPIAVVDPSTAMELIYTSGTTGDPKGIVMTHRRYCDTSSAALRLFGYKEDDTLYTGLSLTHANAQIITLGAALSGGLRCVISRRFTKKRLWAITRKYGCTTFTLLGGMTAALYAEPPQADDAVNPVRFVVSAGMPAAIWHQFEHRFRLRVLEFYGAAEGGLAVKPIGEGPIGSIGKPAPSFMHRIVDASGHDVPPGTPGELLLRHADSSPFRVEYHGMPEASTKKCAGGWLHMGDIVHEDAQGWLFFHHRLGSAIRRNGEFIDPTVVEKAVAESGLVDDVYVYGIAIETSAPGEREIVVAIVPKSGADHDAARVLAACRQKLPPSHVPAFIQTLQEIPKTASEKPQDRFLVEAFHNDPRSIYSAG
ncbi:Long-chain-fatty-acid--CoA ligase [compost metagenome]